MVKLFLHRARWGNARPASGTVIRRKRRQLGVEALETRCLLDAGIYSITGVGNNLANPLWGSVGQDLLRVAPAAYGDGVSSLAGQNRPSPRLISDVIVTDATDGNTPNNRFMADYVYAWGQFIDHDIDLTTGGTGAQLQPANIPVPTGDPFFDPNGTGTQVIDFNRSEFDPNTGMIVNGVAIPRQQINNITAFLDGSMIYGSDPVVADALRTHQGGMLKSSAGADGIIGTQDDMLPFNNHTYFPGISLDPNDPNAAFSIANDAHLVADDQLFMAGDVRANENIELTSVHTLFMREHNRIAASIDKAAPSLSDEKVFQMARSIVIAELQSITFNEFLPALLGNNVVPTYQGYNSKVNPGIATEFSTAGFRLGHSLLAPDVQFLNPDATTKDPALSLANSFFNPPAIEATGADPILKYLATDNAQEIDNLIVPELQNFLFGPPGAGGFDLASLNIQRGRDHGLSDYNTTRAAYGLPKVTSFAQITSDTTLQGKLQQLYGDVNNIDLWVGMLAEDHVPGGSVGPLVQQIVLKQFENIRNGDRLWFENQYSGSTLRAFENTSLQDIIRRNTVNNDLQGNVFFFKMQIKGTVFNDADSNGQQGRGEGGVRGVTVQMIDPTGAVVAQTTTNRNGNYSFDNFSFPIEAAVAYQVKIITPNGAVQTTANPPTLTFTRGETFNNIDFGVHFIGGNAAVPVSPSSTGTGSANAVLVDALAPNSGGTVTTTAPVGDASTNPDEKGASGSSPVVDSASASPQGTAAANPLAPVSISGASTPSGTGADQFWIALGAAPADPLE